MPTRGIRNKNPGNLVLTNLAWRGKVPNPQNSDKHFEQFYKMEDGVRAMLLDLIHDIKKGKNTVRKLINEYAPAFENNTENYIKSVSKSIGLTPDAKITAVNGSFLFLIARAIIKVENGKDAQFVTDNHIKTALKNIKDVSSSDLKVDTTDIKTFSNFLIIPIVLFFYTFLTIII